MVDSKIAHNLTRSDWMGLEQYQALLYKSMILPVGVILSAYLCHEYII